MQKRIRFIVVGKLELVGIPVEFLVLGTDGQHAEQDGQLKGKVVVPLKLISTIAKASQAKAAN